MRSGLLKRGCIVVSKVRVVYRKGVTKFDYDIREDRTLTFTFVVFVVVALCCATNVEISRLQETE